MTEEQKQQQLDIVKYSQDNENILIMLANTAQCYAKLSYKSHKKYDELQSILTIPVIFFSTIIGTASFTNLAKENYFYVSIIVGSINILIGILTTILRYFKISEYTEMYRVSYISWDAYARNILLILPNIPRRNDSENKFGIFFNNKINEFGSLMDSTPIFPKRIINRFEKYIKHMDNQFYKPSQINKNIVSIQFYLNNFKQKNNIKNQNQTHTLHQTQTQTQTQNQNQTDNKLIIRNICMWVRCIKLFNRTNNTELNQNNNSLDISNIPGVIPTLNQTNTDINNNTNTNTNINIDQLSDFAISDEENQTNPQQLQAQLQAQLQQSQLNQNKPPRLPRLIKTKPK